MADRKDRYPDVGAWVLPEVRLERYWHAPGPSAPIPKHAHDGYQFGLSLDAAGEYHYRHPPLYPAGEGPRQPGLRRPWTGDHPSALRPAAGVTGQPAGEPAFPLLVALDPDLARAFLRLCLTLGERPALRMEQDSLLQATPARFVERHADVRLAPKPPGVEHRAVRRVKSYLGAHPAEPGSLIGVHTGGTKPFLFQVPEDLPPAEQEFVTNAQEWMRQELATAFEQCSKPQILAVGPNDSPAGLAS